MTAPIVSRRNSRQNDVIESGFQRNSVDVFAGDWPLIADGRRDAEHGGGEDLRRTRR